MPASLDVLCTQDELRLLCSIEEMSPEVRLALTRWLWDHEIAPSTVALGSPLQRDAERGVVVWHEVQEDLTTRERRLRQPLARPGGDWPARFPAALGCAGAPTGPAHTEFGVPATDRPDRD